MGVLLVFGLTMSFASSSYAQGNFEVDQDTKTMLKGHYESLGRTLQAEKLEVLVLPTMNNVRTWQKVRTVVSDRIPSANLTELDLFINELSENVPQ